MAIIARNDAYGTGLAERPREGRLEGGGSQGRGHEDLRREGPELRRRGRRAAKAANPDAVALIGFDEGSRILTTMVEQGIGPKDVKVYGSDGNMGNALGESFDAGK